MLLSRRTGIMHAPLACGSGTFIFNRGLFPCSTVTVRDYANGDCSGDELHAMRFPQGRCTFGGRFQCGTPQNATSVAVLNCSCPTCPVKNFTELDVPRAELARPNRRVRLHEPGSPMRASYTVRWHGMPEKPVEPDDVSVRAVHP